MFLNKTISLFIISAVFYFSAYSQNSIDTSKTIFAGLFISPDYTMGRIPSGVGLDPGFNTIFVDKGIFAYTLGGYIDYKIRKRINISAGFSYSQKGFDTYYYYRNYINFTFSDTMINEHRYAFYEIPVKLIYYFRIKKINLFASAGLAYTLPKRYSHKVIYSTQPYINFGIPYPEEKRNIEFMLGMGMQIKISRSAYLVINPEYRIMHNPVNFPSYRQLLAFGCNIGIKIEL